MNDLLLKQILEAAILAAGSPLPLTHMEKLFEEMKEADRPTKAALKNALALLSVECETRGIELRELASGYQFRSKQEFAPWLKNLWEERAPRYSRALLETLALIAYKQPITRGEVEDVRGVAVSSAIIKTLLEREWITSVGHKDVPGRPALYATTREFLDYFNLKSLNELPTLEAIKDLMQVGETFAQQLTLSMESPVSLENRQEESSTDDEMKMIQHDHH